VDLADLSVGPRQLGWSDPSSAGVRNRLVRFAGVRQGAELVGTATTVAPRTGEPPLTVLGHGVLHRDPAPPPTAPQPTAPQPPANH
jgi:hypothetical protein